MSRTTWIIASLVAVLIGFVLGIGVLTLWFAPVQPTPIEHVPDPLVGARSSPRAGAPNIVLVIGCTVRRDQTSLYGDVQGTTPFLKGFAATGVTFDDAISAAPWTKAASSAILTGQHPISVGMVEPERRRNDRVLRPAVTTLASYLRGAGYWTMGATANPNLNAIFGFNQGFDDYIQLRELWRTNMTKLEGPEVLELVFDALEGADAERPLYLQVMLVDAHAPFEASASTVEAFAGPDLPERVPQYRAALLGFDRVVADLHAQLQERGFDASNTIFVVASDHGEGLEFPEQHGRAHGRFLFPSAVGAVWTMAGPGIPAGHRMGGMASQVDIAPTLLGLAGVHGYEGPGLDLSARVADKSAATGREMAFSDTWFINVNRAAVYTSDQACQRDFSMRAGVDVHGRFREGCFDRAADPHHETPFPESSTEEVLVQWRLDRESEYATFDVLDADPGDDVVDQLEALGYVDP